MARQRDGGTARPSINAARQRCWRELTHGKCHPQSLPFHARTADAGSASVATATSATATSTTVPIRQPARPTATAAIANNLPANGSNR